MKAVATALVLIAGAAVVLWYGNTLNSWVLGGLIGGLAALLLSIPISLTIFSYLSRRHDDRVQAEQAEIQEEMSLAQVHEYSHLPVGVAEEAYAVEGYMLAEDHEWDELEEENAQYYANVRELPVQSSQYQQQQTAMYREQSTSRLPVPRQGTYLPQVVRQQPKALPAPRGKDGRRLTTRHLNYPGFPGRAPTARGQYQSAALRAARQEAIQQYHDDIAVVPTYNNGRRSQARQYQAEHEHGERATTQRPSRQFPATGGQPRPRRTIESTSTQTGARRALPPAREDALYYAQEPRTDRLENNYPQTEQLRPAMQTGQTARHPRIDDQLRNPDVVTGSLKNPLLRRAPYTYEDDPLRQELAQQVYPPVVRRSSRYEQRYEDGE